MKVQDKPDYLVFASDAQPGELESFPNIARGWGVTIEQTESKPPMEWMNDAFNRIDKNMLYLLQQGVPEWDSSVLYPVDAVIKYKGELYIALIENDSVIPPINEEKWKKIIPEVKDASIVQKGIVQLSSAIDSDIETIAATSKAVKTLNDKLLPIYSNVGVDSNNGLLYMFSPSHRYRLVVKNDGWSGVWDGELSRWVYAFDPNGYLSAGTISALGINQRWQDVTTSRQPGVNYTNTTGKPIMIAVLGQSNGQTVRLVVDGVLVSTFHTGGFVAATMTAIVPNGSQYAVSGGDIGFFAELR